MKKIITLVLCSFILASCFKEDTGIRVTESFEKALEEYISGSGSAEPYVDLGLSVKWASCNLGASKPEETGDYYMWADTEISFPVLGNCPYHKGTGMNVTWTKYNDEDGKTVLEPEDDAACVILGDKWRMPTKDEILELKDDCTWTWTTVNEVEGYLVSGKKPGYTDKSIFIPMVGYREGNGLINNGVGYYWSSTSVAAFASSCLVLSRNEVKTDFTLRQYALPIRPVYGEAAVVPEPEEPAIPEVLPGSFSVSDNETVCFSRGNLFYDVSKKTWDFYNHQYDCAGGYEDQIISLFTFGYDAVKSIVPDGCRTDNVNIAEGLLPLSQDWGSAVGDGKTWRTLSAAEWQHLFSRRKASTVCGIDNARYAKGTVNGVSGIILLPDSYSHPSGLTSLKQINDGTAAFSYNKYTAEQWAGMESAGAVFLPAAGRRYGSTVSYIGKDGGYWSTSAQDVERAYRVYFTTDAVKLVGSYEFREAGCSVRPVCRNSGAAPAPTVTTTASVYASIQSDSESRGQ